MADLPVKDCPQQVLSAVLRTDFAIALHVDEVEKLLKEREDDLEKLIAISHVKRAAEEGVTRAKLEEMREGIERDIGKFRGLVDAPPRRQQHEPAAAMAASE